MYKRFEGTRDHLKEATGRHVSPRDTPQPPLGSYWNWLSSPMMGRFYAPLLPHSSRSDTGYAKFIKKLHVGFNISGTEDLVRHESHVGVGPSPLGMTAADLELWPQPMP